MYRQKHKGRQRYTELKGGLVEIPSAFFNISVPEKYQFSINS